MEVLILSPEPPYPLNSGGAFRTASLLNYFARFAQVDLILISQSGDPAMIPAGLVRSQQVIPLQHHNRSLVARFFRNAGRAIRGVRSFSPDRTCYRNAHLRFRHRRTFLVRPVCGSIIKLL
jgi:hypothetical protein